MIYIMSDLHGCYDKYLQMLDKINFGDDDTLYILGDIVDRGDCGIDAILDIAKRKNVISLLGNHDYYAKTFFNLYCNDRNSFGSAGVQSALKSWLSDGGQATYDKFIALDADKQSVVLQYLEQMELYKPLKVNGVKYLLSHTVPEKRIMKKFPDFALKNFIMGEPDYELKYFADVFLVTGHTPTGFIDEDYVDRIYCKNNHIAIDCGAVFGHKLGCICLDNLQEFYV